MHLCTLYNVHLYNGLEYMNETILLLEFRRSIRDDCIVKHKFTHTNSLANMCIISSI